MTSRKARLPAHPRVLVVRTDRIGDVVLSLPVFASIRAAYPGGRIIALTREYTRPLLEDRDDVDDVISFDAETSHVPRSAFMGLLARLRRERLDAAVALFSNFSVAALLFAAGIPVRVGPASKAAQVFFTHRIRQRRSKLLRHEADHNLDLLAPLGIAPVRRARITPPPPPGGLEKRCDRPLVGIHPGHGGSARSWPVKNWAALADALSASGADVVVTGSPAERELAESVARRAGAPVRVYIGEGGLMELAAALSALDVFAASSTGPLHIASAVGTPVVGIYCPIFVCLPQRWGPIGENDTALTPDVSPCERCSGEACEYWDCMERIGVERVRDEVLSRTRRLSKAER